MYAIATKITSLASAQNAPIYFLHEYGWGLLSGQCLTEEPGIILSSNPQCCKGFFSQSQLSVQTLLQCPYSPGVQLHASTSVCMLKIPNMGIHIVWTHKNTAHSDTLIKMGSVALVVADLLRKGDPNLPQGTMKY